MRFQESTTETSQTFISTPMPSIPCKKSLHICVYSMKFEHHPPRLVGSFFPSQVEIHVFEVTLLHNLPPTVWESLHRSEAKLKCHRLLYWPIKATMIIWLPLPARNYLSVNEENIPVASRWARPASASQQSKNPQMLLSLLIINRGKIYCTAYSLPSIILSIDREDPGHNFLTLCGSYRKWV